jgi:hypothetical protein
MAPLSGFEHHRLTPLWNRLGALLFRHGEHFYNFQGLRAFKEKFDPVWEPRYLAAPGGLAAPLVLTDVAADLRQGDRGGRALADPTFEQRVESRRGWLQQMARRSSFANACQNPLLDVEKRSPCGSAPLYFASPTPADSSGGRDVGSGLGRGRRACVGFARLQAPLAPSGSSAPAPRSRRRSGGRRWYGSARCGQLAGAAVSSSSSPCTHWIRSGSMRSSSGNGRTSPSWPPTSRDVELEGGLRLSPSSELDHRGTFARRRAFTARQDSRRTSSRSAWPWACQRSA